jgi:hypothetical protein
LRDYFKEFSYKDTMLLHSTAIIRQNHKTALQQHCNSTATALQQHCNIVDIDSNLCISVQKNLNKFFDALQNLKTALQKI